MSVIETITTNFDMKSSADKLWSAIIDLPEILSKSSPELFKNVQVVEGDAKSVGSVVKFDILPVTFGMTSITVKYTLVDNENKIWKYDCLDMVSLMKSKYVGATFTLVPKANDDGCVAKWDAVYEKLSPFAILDVIPIAMLVKLALLGLDAYLICKT